jgi:hypothetical protein
LGVIARLGLFNNELSFSFEFVGLRQTRLDLVFELAREQLGFAIIDVREYLSRPDFVALPRGHFGDTPGNTTAHRDELARYPRVCFRHVIGPVPKLQRTQYATGQQDNEHD